MITGTMFTMYGFALCQATGRIRAIETERIKTDDGSRLVRSGFMSDGPTWPNTNKGRAAAGHWSMVNSVHAFAMADMDTAEVEAHHAAECM